ncbi:MAG: NAD(P)/FAD-dependent oxidoreductase [Betaproteobacteria bacterium]
MSAPHDLVVVGASFAGVACAIAAARAGAKVALVERKRDPGARLHTTGIVVKEALAAIEAIAPLPASVVRPIAGVRLHAPGGASIALDHPGYFFLATDTPALMRWLVACARDAGVEVALGEAWSGGDRIEGGWRTRSGRETRFLVGADGPASRVARDCALGRNTRFLFGAEAELAGATLDEPGRLHCFLDAKRARGYLGWAFEGVGVVQVGLACARAAASPLPDVAAFVRAISPRIGLAGGTLVATRAGLIPVGGPVAPRAADRVTLIGDAAGLVSPLTAGGIHTALASGWRAGQAIAAALAHDSGGALVVDPVVPRFTVKRWMRVAYDRMQSDRWFDLAIGNPAFAALARLVFFRRRGPGP